MADSTKIKDCKIYEWYGDEEKLRRRYRQLLSKGFKSEKLTQEEKEEFEILAEIMSSDH